MTTSIPSISKCLSLMDEHAMLENIKAHSLVVASVARTIMNGFHLSREHLPSMDVVIAGALLHDIAKTRCIAENCNHAEVGREMCVSQGYIEIGDIVREHVILYSFSKERYREAQFSAKDIVYYSDKRVTHDRIVNLDERLEYIFQRYGNNDKKRHLLIKENFKKCQELERYIFSHLEFQPSELAKRVTPFST